MALNDYSSTGDVSAGDLGPCIVAGHPKEHTITIMCLRAMTDYFYNDGRFGRDFSDFIKAVKRK